MSFTIETKHFGAMPNQAEGTLNGERFYFRARHGEWALQVSNDDPVSGRVIDSGTDVMNGEEPGWWSEESTLEFLTKLLEKHSNADK